MFYLFVFHTAILALALLTPENAVVTIAGAIVAYFGTNWIKSATGIYRVGALLLAVAVSFVTAVVAIIASSYLGGSEISLQNIGHAMPQIFLLATVAYKIVSAYQEDNK